MSAPIILRSSGSFPYTERSSPGSSPVPGRSIIVENNFSGQFYRYLRSETGLAVDGHIPKYDGEPFMPHHIADGVQELIAGTTDVYVPYQEILV